MEIHEWMINYTRQTEWIDRRGIFLWIAFYAGGLGGGLYLVSLYFNSLWGMFLSWLIIAVVKGGAHLIYLGKPLRFWRIVFRPNSSWLARGIIFVLAFVLFAAVQLGLSYWLPGTAIEIVFKVLAGMAALAVTVYTGFVLNTVKAVPFWNSTLLPLLFVLCGILGGFGLSVIIGLNGGNVNIAAAETGSRWLLIANALLIVVYLWAAANRETTGKKSVVEQMRGNLAPVFWIGIVVLGIVIPLAIAFSSYLVGEVSSVLLVTGVACEVIGGLALRYCVLKAGAYKPLVAIAS
ncbi:MAG TPA: NrfD/PsrC family molybdoenzyme membrane anchor subunit [Dehalococcoidales bacterium]|nr:NrfD/PsrC family molybdoenzyme membrane anchor subunit [Dehalococcoidales bacterium]